MRYLLSGGSDCALIEVIVTLSVARAQGEACKRMKIKGSIDVGTVFMLALVGLVVIGAVELVILLIWFAVK